MIIKTKEFQEVANKILFASGLDAATNIAGKVELVAEDTNLYLNVTNKEYYVSVKFALEEATNFRAVVDAALFLNLISGFNTETFELIVDANMVKVSAGKSSYKLPMIYENDKLLQLTKITLDNVTVDMPVSQDILMSILNVNSKELQKAKKLDVAEIQKLYYIDETGCFTFTTGACLNKFTLEKPIKILLNERIVKLFKLFTDASVNLKFGYDVDNIGTQRPKLVLSTDSVYMAARINCDDTLIHKIQRPCEATKGYISEPYTNHVVFSANEMLSAISRVMMFSKNIVAKSNTANVPVTVTFAGTDMMLVDSLGNIETVAIENGSTVDPAYTMKINLVDFKAVLDSCKNEHLTMNCGNHRSIVINHGNFSNVIPECD